MPSTAFFFCNLWINLFTETIMQVSVSASLWCVMETRTVRTVWTSETAAKTTAWPCVTLTKHLQTLTSQVEGK